MAHRQKPIELFMPPNMLKAKLGGGGFAAEAAARAETVMEALRDDFADWAEQDVARLAAARQAYAEKRDAPSRDELLRAAHDMKGQAATFDFPLMARVAGSLSCLVEDLPPEKELPMTLVDAHVDAIQVIYRDQVKDTSDKTALALAQALEARVAEILA